MPSPFDISNAALPAIAQLDWQRFGLLVDIEIISHARKVLLECSSRNTRPPGMLDVFMQVLAEFLKRDEGAITEEEIERVFTEAAAALAVVEAGQHLELEQYEELRRLLFILERRILFAPLLSKSSPC